MVNWSLDPRIQGCGLQEILCSPWCGSQMGEENLHHPTAEIQTKHDSMAVIDYRLKERFLDTIGWSKFHLKLNSTVGIHPDCVKKRLSTDQWLRFNLRCDPTVSVDSDPDKDLNVEFWSDLVGPLKIRWSKIIHKDIIYFLKVLGLPLWLEKVEKFIYK